MAAIEPVGHTESEKTSSHKYVKKRAAQLKIKWRIDEFEALMNTTEPGEGRLRSEGVSSELVPRAIWVLEVYPNGWNWEGKGNISINLWLTGLTMGDMETLDTAYHIYLFDGSTGSKINVEGRRARNFGKNEGRGGDASHDQVKKALHEDGSLLVAADIEFLLPDECGAETISESTLRGYEDLQRWATKFSDLHGGEASSNCTIQIGGVAIPAHKSILAAHSPIFRSMLSHPEEEEFQSGIIKVTDFNEPEPMRALVRYCYMGPLDDATMDGDGAVEIFQLADKYLIDDLKATLEEHFINKRLSVGNVIEMAMLADMHSAPKLKKVCTKLIAEEWDTVSESTDWKRLEEEMPELATELAEAATAKE